MTEDFLRHTKTDNRLAIWSGIFGF